MRLVIKAHLAPMDRHCQPEFLLCRANYVIMTSLVSWFLCSQWAWGVRMIILWHHKFCRWC